MSEDSNIPPTARQDEAEPGGFTDPDLPSRKSVRWNEVWVGLLRLGLGESSLRIGAGLVLVLLAALVIWVMGSFYLQSRTSASTQAPGAGGPIIALPGLTPTASFSAPPFNPLAADFSSGIPRLVTMHTDRPDRVGFQMLQYTIVEGDTLFGLADRFGITPATILFSNKNTLYDDPHRIYPGQTLTIPPVDGAIYDWHAGDGLNGVSEYYKVTPDAILDWPGNNLDRKTIGDLSHPNIEPGTALFIPGGTRAFTSWGAPFIGRSDPAKAKIFGPGFCGEQYSGYVGNGIFIWPTTETWLSGYDWSPGANHWGIDIAGQIGNAIYASDSGVVVYAGWNDRGYGNVIVIDHGNGFQTLYAHLNSIGVGCGQSVSQGEVIAGLGTTGRSTGPHLHFEVMSETGGRLDPHSFLNQ